MSKEKETKFPETDSDDRINQIADWFKRCMADYPEPYPIYVNDRTKEILHMVFDGEGIDAWKKKWFDQFEEKP